MPLFYLDPQDVPRECPGCDKGLVDMPPEVAHRYEKSPIHNGEVCPICHGSGRLGNPDGPRVEVVDRRKLTGHGPSRWIWRKKGGALGLGFGGWSHDSYPTSEAALEAAREAYQCRE